jgi:hypothetical protein
MNPKDSNVAAEQALDQRIRNRIIETLETMASQELCTAVGPDEVVNLWYDFVPECKPEMFPSPTYTNAEREGINRVNEVLDRVVRSTPNPMPPLTLLQREPVWVELVEACRDALVALNARGRSVESD